MTTDPNSNFFLMFVYAGTQRGGLEPAVGAAETPPRVIAPLSDAEEREGKVGGVGGVGGGGDGVVSGGDDGDASAGVELGADE